MQDSEGIIWAKMMNTYPDIEINNLSFSYDTVPVLEEVNLRVEHGEFRVPSP